MDRNSQATFFNLDASRRIGERFTLEIETRLFLNIPATDILVNQRRDSFVQVRLS